MAPKERKGNNIKGEIFVVVVVVVVVEHMWLNSLVPYV